MGCDYFLRGAGDSNNNLENGFLSEIEKYI